MGFKMSRMVGIFLLIGVLHGSLLAAEKNEEGAFIIEIGEEAVIVKSPTKETLDKTVILHNKTFSKIFAKVIDREGKQLGLLTVASGDRFVGTYNVEKKDEAILLVILMPAIPEIELKEGKSYAIPQRR